MTAKQSTIDWLRSYYDAMDNLRFDEVAEYLHEECRNHYPTGVEVVGREAILERGRTTLGALERIRHDLQNAWEEGDELIFELEVTYWRKDGTTIVRPGVGIFVLDDGRIREQRLFVDNNAVWN
jgi:ketosteroid isomerase-like protein